MVGSAFAFHRIGRPESFTKFSEYRASGQRASIDHILEQEKRSEREGKIKRSPKKKKGKDGKEKKKRGEREQERIRREKTRNKKKERKPERRKNKKKTRERRKKEKRENKERRARNRKKKKSSHLDTRPEERERDLLTIGNFETGLEDYELLNQRWSQITDTTL